MERKEVCAQERIGPVTTVEGRVISGKIAESLTPTEEEGTDSVHGSLMKSFINSSNKILKNTEKFD